MIKRTDLAIARDLLVLRAFIIKSDLMPTADLLSEAAARLVRYEVDKALTPNPAVISEAEVASVVDFALGPKICDLGPNVVPFPVAHVIPNGPLR